MTETWLTSALPDSLLTGGTHFSLYRKDRISGQRGGGVGLFVNNATVTSCLVKIPDEFDCVEIIVADIISSDVPIRIFVCYRPPSSSETDSDAVNYITLLTRCIAALSDPKFTLLVTGDFNFPKINWLKPNSLYNDNGCPGVFLDFVSTYLPHQFVHDFTRFDSLVLHGSLLDLIFSNDPNFVFNTSVIDNFSTSDHCIVNFDIAVKSVQRPSTSTFYNFERADWEGANNYLYAVDFNSLFSQCSDVCDTFDAMYGVIRTCIERFVPLCTIDSGRSGKAKYPYYIRRLYNRKASAWRTYRKCRTQCKRAKYKTLVTQCRLAVKRYTAKRELNIASSDNIRKFYCYANRHFNCKTLIGPLLSDSGELVVDPTSKAELLQNSFCANWTNDNHVIPTISRTAPDDVIDTIIFTPDLVKRAVTKLRTHAKGGPDGVPPLFLKRCINVLCSPLAYLFTLSLEYSFLPADWLRAFVTPVFKKGDANDPNNYRPIALTCTLCKVMEVIIKDQLMLFLLRTRAISPNQHGFLRKKSTTTNLLECIHDWVISISHKSSVEVIYIDFSRAFDSIVFQKLFAKVKSYGVCGLLLDWIKSFVQNRTQCVVIENRFSSVKNVISGVPQGSVLGPLLFLLFINDVAENFSPSTFFKMFADDLKLYSSLYFDGSREALQWSLDCLLIWSEIWQLFINLKKCLFFCLTPYFSNISTNQYCLGGLQLPSCDRVSDLGILLDSKLSFVPHIENIISKANQRCGIFFRGFVSRNYGIVVKIFTTYIRPLLEYNSHIWSPTVKYLIQKLERVQRRFTKRVPSLQHKSYRDRLLALKLEPLELRRIKADLILYYKIINNLSCISPSSAFAFHTDARPLRNNNPLRIIKPLNIPQRLMQSFFTRSIDIWNSLPVHITTASSLSSFRRLLNSHDLSNYLKCDYN